MSSLLRFRLLHILGTGIIATVVVWATIVGGDSAGAGSPETPDALVSIGVGVVLLVVLWPQYVRQPKRRIEGVSRTAQRVTVGIGLVALVGYLNVAIVPGPTALILSGLVLVFALPAWFELLDNYAASYSEIVVGDDPVQIEEAIQSLPTEPAGIISPSISAPQRTSVSNAPKLPIEGSPELSGEVTNDGGEVQTMSERQTSDRPTESAGIDRIGGLSCLRDVLSESNTTNVTLAFSHTDREEFFGALRTCRDFGIDVKVHETHADCVLLAGDSDGKLVEADIEPWPWYSRALKRSFDVAFASIGLIVLTPLLVAISVAIKLDSPGPILYRQTRTGRLGKEFTLSKFRSMETDAERDRGPALSAENAGETDGRVTRVGRVLRKTHMDEIPQLVAVLFGSMSVVGPRPERPELEAIIGSHCDSWAKRWMLKPGLTGIAQVNNVTGAEPSEKLEHDLTYARDRTLWLDVQLVYRQILIVLRDATEIVLRSEQAERDDDFGGEEG